MQWKNLDDITHNKRLKCFVPVNTFEISCCDKWKITTILKRIVCPGTFRFLIVKYHIMSLKLIIEDNVLCMVKSVEENRRVRLAGRIGSCFSHELNLYPNKLILVNLYLCSKKSLFRKLCSTVKFVTDINTITI